MSESQLVKVGIVGSRKFRDRKRVDQWLDMFLRTVDLSILCIVSGACPDGADYLAKTAALDRGILYRHFPPVHRRWDEWCVLDASHYNKEYHVKNFFDRNTDIAEYSAAVVTLIVPGIPSKGSMDTITKAQKMDKPTWVDDGETVTHTPPNH